MLIVANWKAYIEDLTRAKRLFSLSKRLSRRPHISIVLAPPSVFLGALSPGNTSSVAFCAQDISVTTGGAATGELTAQAVAAVGALYTIVGHSERRASGETNAVIAQKIAHALAHSLTPILCIGEHERDADAAYLAFLREQISSALQPLTQKERGRVILAYEPIWAIGKTADDAIRASDLSEMLLYIRKVLAEYLPGKSASHSIILYGGSVEPDNALDLATNTAADGFLIGHASATETAFSELVQAIS